jgi:hypothetical protein
MAAVLSFSEIAGQHVELLPARTVLSLFSAGGSRGGNTGTGTGGTGTGGTGTGGEGGNAHGKAILADNWFYTEGDVYTTVIGATGGTGGAGTGGPGTVGS